MTVIGSSVVDAFFDIPLDLLRGRQGSRAINIPFGEKVISEEQHVCVGGAGANVSIGLAKCGFDVLLNTSYGQDALGRFIAESLAGRLRVRIVNATPKTSMSVVFLIGSERTIITPNHAPTSLAKTLPKKGAIHCGPIHDAANDICKELSGHVERTGQQLSVNPSMETIRARSRGLMKLLKRTSILFLNRSEAIALARADSDATAVELLARVQKMGPAVVCITQGSRGACLRSRSGVALHAGPLVDVFDTVDATGAGDAFASGFLSMALGSGWADRESLRRSLAAGTVNAASVVGRVGAQDGLLHRRQIEEYISRVKISSL